MVDTIGNLAVVITATDKASATIKGIGGNLGQLAKPVSAVSDSFARLGGTSALRGLSSGVATAHAQVSSLAGTITRAALPLSGLGFVGAATAAVSNFTNTGRQLLSGSRALGMSVPALHAFQNGASQAGISAEDATDGLKAFDRTLWDAVGGRNHEAASASTLPRLGFAIRDAAGNARHGADALGDLADKLALLKNEPRALQDLARTWNVESLIPMLVNGRAGLEALLNKGRDLGTMTAEQAAQAKRLDDQWRNLGRTGDRLSTSIGGALAPAIGQAADSLDRLIRKNEAWLTPAITNHISELVTGVGSYASALSPAITNTIGWDRAFTALEIVMAARVLKTLTGINTAAIALGAIKLPFWATRMLGIGAASTVALGSTLALKGDTNQTSPEAQQSLDDRLRRKLYDDPTISWATRHLPPSWGGAYNAEQVGQADAYRQATPRERGTAGLPMNMNITPGSSALPQGGNRAGFVGRYGAAAQEMARLTGTDAQFWLGQWGNETGWGRSVAGNNLGNVKPGSSWRGPTVTQADGEAYRAYATPEAFARDAAALVNRQYPGALNQGSNFQAAAEALKRGGYATDPAYIAKTVNAARSLGGGMFSTAPAPTASPVAPVSAPVAPVRSPLDASPGPQASAGTVSVDVRFANAPRGLIANVRPEGNVRADAPLVETAMQPTGAR